MNLEKIDVLKVDFKLPELFLPSVNVGQTVDVIVDALPGRTFAGEIYAIDPQVDVNGRALQLRARLPNADFALRPGLFARVVVKGKQTREVVLVPESAIVPRGGETFVFRIENGKADRGQGEARRAPGRRGRDPRRACAQHAGRHGRPAQAAQRRRPSRSSKPGRPAPAAKKGGS